MTTMNNEDPADPSVHEHELPEPVAWAQPNHLQQARLAPFMCRVEPTQRHADFVPLYTADQMRETIAEERVQRTRPAPMASSAIARCMIRVSDPLLWGRMGDGCGVLAEEFARAIEHECHEHITQRASAQPGQTAAARDVLAERRRQIEVEGYDTAHDDSHVNDEIAALACFYVMPPGAREWCAESTGYGDTLGEAILPENWEAREDDRRTELVKAGALVLAEIERLDRAAEKEQPK